MLSLTKGEKPGHFEENNSKNSFLIVDSLQVFMEVTHLFILGVVLLLVIGLYEEDIVYLLAV